MATALLSCDEAEVSLKFPESQAAEEYINTASKQAGFVSSLHYFNTLQYLTEPYDKSLYSQ